MKIRSIRHRGLRRLIVDDDTSGVGQAVADKLRRIVGFLQDMQREEELRSVPTWKAHQLSGVRAGMWSLHVTKNWRLVFRIDANEPAIVDLDYEDYH